MLSLSSPAVPALWEDVEAGAVSPESLDTQAGLPYAEQSDAGGDDDTVGGEAEEMDEVGWEEERYRVQLEAAMLEAAVAAALIRLQELEGLVVARGYQVPEDELKKEFEAASDGAYSLFEKLAASVTSGHGLAAARERVDERVVKLWNEIRAHNSRLAQHEQKATQKSSRKLWATAAAILLVSIWCFVYHTNHVQLGLGVVCLLLAAVYAALAAGWMDSKSEPGGVISPATDPAVVERERYRKRRRQLHLFAVSKCLYTGLYI